MLIHCTAHREGHRLGELPLTQLSDVLRTARADSTFVWVALHDPSPEELAPLQAAFDLHPLAVEDALQPRQRPKVEEYGESLFAVLHLLSFETDVPHVPHGAQPPRLQAGQLAIFAGPHYVVSVRRHSEASLAPVRERCEREPELLRQGPGFVLYMR